MSEVQAGAAADRGAEIILPGSTHGGLLPDPQVGWSVLFGHESTAFVTLDGTLDELEVTLADALAKVRWSKSNVAVANIESTKVEVDGYVYTVPAGCVTEGLSRQEIERIAVFVREPEDDGCGYSPL